MSTDHRYVLVTGTNSGLGLGICLRLIDDFLATQALTTSLTLIFTTRSSRKGSETVQILQSHLNQKHQTAARTKRIHLQPENVELTNLLSVRALALKMNDSDIPKLDALVFNAGLAGWSGLDWFQAVPDVLKDMRSSTTWPRFKIGMVGLLTDRQIPPGATQTQPDPEPPLGQVFCANVFGHYMLAHGLMPLLRACPDDTPGRIIWVGSIEPRQRHLNEEDMQALTSNSAYEASKRLIDLLALTYDQPASKSAVARYTTPPNHLAKSTRPVRSQPTMHTTQPGILTTTIIALYWIVHQAYYLAIWFARVLGAPWSTLDAYPAAMSMTWLVFAPRAEIDAQEATFGNAGGRVKWGTAASRFGKASVRPTEVDGWGINGSGREFAHTWWAGKLGRAPGAIDATKEDVDEFVAQGARVWQAMEELREEWEDRITPYEKLST